MGLRSPSDPSEKTKKTSQHESLSLVLLIKLSLFFLPQTPSLPGNKERDPGRGKVQIHFCLISKVFS